LLLLLLLLLLYLAVVTVLRIQVTVSRFVTPSADRCNVYVVPNCLYPQIDVRCITGRTTTAVNIIDCMDCARIRVWSQRYDTCVRRQLTHSLQYDRVCRSLPYALSVPTDKNLKAWRQNVVWLYVDKYVFAEIHLYELFPLFWYGNWRLKFVQVF
jgi:hypothetical protein